MLLCTQMTKLKKTASSAGKEQSSGSSQTLLKGIYISAGKLELPIRVEDVPARSSQGFHCSRIFPTETCAYVYQRYTYKNILRSVIPDSPKPEIAQMLTNNRMEKFIVLYSYNVKLYSNENEWTYAIFRKWITHKHTVVWKKSDSQIYISCDSGYKFKTA